MRKVTYFLDHPSLAWPNERWLAPYFLTPAGRDVAFGMDNDSWSVTAECVDGTESLPREKQIDLDLHIVGKPDLGVMLFYDRWSAIDGKAYYSKRDLRNLHTWVRTKHGNRAPVGLFIPFEQALKAVMEFIAADGALPKCIEWVDSSDLPEGTFPEPEVTLRD
jgi:hypothetical protein